MTNQDISHIFTKMAAYCEMSSDKNAFFRARAFKKAAEVVAHLTDDLSEPQWHDLKKLNEIEGVGERIAKHILDFTTTGKIPEYEDMKTKSPINLDELLRVQGVGPKTIKTLYDKLGITDLKTLETAARADKIANLDGFGVKKQQNIIESLEFAITNKDRIRLDVAQEHIEAILEYMQGDPHLQKIEAVGSYRRRAETIGDIDLLASSKNPEKTFEYFVNYPLKEKILGQGETKASLWLSSKIQADMRIIPLEVFGSGLQYFTGGKEHNISMRQLAIEKGFKLSEYGVIDRKTEKVLESKDEKKVYEKVCNHYIEPVLRENSGEIEAAIAGKLPKLIVLKDIIGDYHMHSTNSDGNNTILEMAESAIKMGYSEIGISDHFGNLVIANAITPEKFDDYLSQIRTANKKISDIEIYAAAEVEITKNGTLDFDQKMLEQLDYVIASVHMSTKMSREEMTERIIAAIENPVTKIIAHPTGRIINQRPGFDFDYEKVFKVAAENSVAMEINAHPSRLDLSWNLVKMAISLGCKITINSDSHTIDLNTMRFGVDMARKGWMTKKDLWKPARK